MGLCCDVEGGVGLGEVGVRGINEAHCHLLKTHVSVGSCLSSSTFAN